MKCFDLLDRFFSRTSFIAMTVTFPQKKSGPPHPKENPLNHISPHSSNFKSKKCSQTSIYI